MKIILGDPRATPKNVLSSHLIISKGNELDLSAVVADVHNFMNGHLPCGVRRHMKLSTVADGEFHLNFISLTRAGKFTVSRGFCEVLFVQSFGFRWRGNSQKLIIRIKRRGEQMVSLSKCLSRSSQ